MYMNFRNLLKTSVFGITLLAIGAVGGLNAAINLSTATGTWSNATGNPVNYTGNGTSTIHWGNPVSGGNKSGYNYTGLAPQNNIGVDTAFAIGTFTHYNYPITGNTLTGVDLNVHEGLTVDGTAVSFSGTYKFNHNETPNVGGNNCCNDIVTFLNNMSTLSTFKVNGQDYTIALIGFKTTANGPLLSQFSTIEGKTNTATLYAKVTKHVGVPEPSTYLMMSAFLGIAFVLASRRKKVSIRS